MTGPELMDLWDERDRRYAIRRHHLVFMPLSEREQVTIRAWRERELEEIRASAGYLSARNYLSAWMPPLKAT